MRTDAAVDVQGLNAGPHLDYRIYVFTPGEATARLTLGPALNFAPDRPVRIAVSMDSEAPQVLTIVPQGYNAANGNRDWEQSVRDNARYVTSRAPDCRPRLSHLQGLDGRPRRGPRAHSHRHAGLGESPQLPGAAGEFPRKPSIARAAYVVSRIAHRDDCGSQGRNPTALHLFRDPAKWLFLDPRLDLKEAHRL